MRLKHTLTSGSLYLFRVALHETSASLSTEHRMHLCLGQVYRKSNLQPRLPICAVCLPPFRYHQSSESPFQFSFPRTNGLSYCDWPQRSYEVLTDSCFVVIAVSKSMRTECWPCLEVQKPLIVLQVYRKRSRIPDLLHQYLQRRRVCRLAASISRRKSASTTRHWSNNNLSTALPRLPSQSQ